MIRQIILGAAMLLAGVSVPAQKVVVVELFTSEGCSSCPPADALLRQLNGTRTTSGDLYVAISEHVTYWNSLGWHDPFSSETMTQRQQAYGGRFGRNDVYTPQAIVNGEAQVLGSDRNAITRAAAAVHHPAASLHIGAARRDGDQLAITFTLSGAPNPADIYAVIAEDAATTSVPRGENSGRTLAHAAVASTLQKVATTGDAADKTVRVTIPALPAGASGKRHLILFAQQKGLGPILAAETAAL